MAGQKEEGFTKRPTSLADKIAIWLKDEDPSMTPQQARHKISRQNKGPGGLFRRFVLGIDSFLSGLGK